MHICTARSKSSSVSCPLASPEPDRQGSAGSLLARLSTPHSTTRLCSRYSSSVISPSEKAWFRSRSRSMATARTSATRCTNELDPKVRTGSIAGRNFETDGAWTPKRQKHLSRCT
eukprot:scaffold10856_cov63-Phaeocystis_antarctica.AAC.1